MSRPTGGHRRCPRVTSVPRRLAAAVDTYRYTAGWLLASIAIEVALALLGHGGQR